MYETSANFDLDDLKNKLQQLSKLFQQGFGLSEIENLEQTVTEMELDCEIEFKYEVIFNNQASNIIISIFMDDVDSPDVSFYSENEHLIRLIDSELKRYLDIQ